MDSKYPIVAKATICSEYTHWQSQEEYRFLYAESLTDAAQQMERYYGDEIIKCDFAFIDEKGTLLLLDPKFAERLIDESIS